MSKWINAADILIEMIISNLPSSVEVKRIEHPICLNVL